eukprot:8096308-Lingulodinium_polyedra.AAC.1
MGRGRKGPRTKRAEDETGQGRIGPRDKTVEDERGEETTVKDKTVALLGVLSSARFVLDRFGLG